MNQLARFVPGVASGTEISARHLTAACTRRRIGSDVIESWSPLMALGYYFTKSGPEASGTQGV